MAGVSGSCSGLKPVGSPGADARRSGRRWRAGRSPRRGPCRRRRCAGSNLLRLREQEVQHHRLARAGRADDREVAEVALVEVEVVGRRRGGLQQRDRLAPVIAARPGRPGSCGSEAKPAKLAVEISARRTMYLEVAGELAPEGGLQVDVLAHRDRADLGQARPATSATASSSAVEAVGARP